MGRRGSDEQLRGGFLEKQLLLSIHPQKKLAPLKPKPFFSIFKKAPLN